MRSKILVISGLHAMSKLQTPQLSTLLHHILGDEPLGTRVEYYRLDTSRRYCQLDNLPFRTTPTVWGKLHGNSVLTSFLRYKRVNGPSREPRPFKSQPYSYRGGRGRLLIRAITFLAAGTSPFILLRTTSDADQKRNSTTYVSTKNVATQRSIRLRRPAPTETKRLRQLPLRP